MYCTLHSQCMHVTTYVTTFDKRSPSGDKKIITCLASAEAAITEPHFKKNLQSMLCVVAQEFSSLLK